MKRILTNTRFLLALLILLWGTSWPIYKVAIPFIPPLLFAALRALIGGMLLTLVIWRRYKTIHWRAHWYKYTISALFNAVLFFALQTIGLHYLPGGLFSVLVYCQPIVLSIFAWYFLNEYLSFVKLLGLVLGFIGIIVASMEGVTTHFSIIGITLALLTGIAWAYGVLYVKKISGEVDGYWIVAMQNVIGGIILMFGSLLFEDWTTVVWNTSLISAVAYGTTLGVPAAFLIYYSLIHKGEASKVSAATFLVPIVSVVISVIFLKEALTVKLFIGMILVGLSIYLVNRQPKTATKSLKSA